MNRIKYLVRQLTLIEGGADKRLSLQYIELKDGELLIFPFDFERPGFIYVPELSLIKTSDGWEEGEASTFIS